MIVGFNLARGLEMGMGRMDALVVAVNAAFLFALVYAAVSMVRARGVRR